jgi:DNA mismatch endonuclease, patch repair protein
MTDIVDKKTRSRMMSGIRGRNTKPELAVRKFLSAAGLRYRLHPKNVFGRPDLVLPRLRRVVLVHGCFWHRHRNCRFAYTPKSNLSFWTKKFDANVARDKVVRSQLRRAGWKTHLIWECQVNEKGLNRLLKQVTGTKPRP